MRDYQIQSYHILSCPILSYPILFYPTHRLSPLAGSRLDSTGLTPKDPRSPRPVPPAPAPPGFPVPTHRQTDRQTDTPPPPLRVRVDRHVYVWTWTWSDSCHWYVHSEFCVDTALGTGDWDTHPLLLRSAAQSPSIDMKKKKYLRMGNGWKEGDEGRWTRDEGRWTRRRERRGGVCILTSLGTRGGFRGLYPALHPPVRPTVGSPTLGSMFHYM